MPKIMADPVCCPGFSCFSEVESSNLNRLLLIPLCFARARASAADNNPGTLPQTAEMAGRYA